MTNDFSQIPSESEFRTDMTVRSDESNPAYSGPMGVFTGMDDLLDEPVDGPTDEDETDGHEPDESMDGDFDSAMASAGLGTDEDYGYYGGDCE